MYEANFNPDPDAPVTTDWINPAARTSSLGGGFARMLLENELDVNCMRPYICKNKRAAITRNVVQHDGTFKRVRQYVHNDNATLRFLDWIQLDEAVVKAAKPRLRAAGDLVSAGLVYSLPNGIAKTVMQYQQQSDISGATVSMDGMRQSESDRPVFSLLNFPLPIIHKDFQISLRELLASRTGYSPLDTTTAELAGRRVAEQVEQFTLGTTNTLLLGQASYTYGGNTIYGYMNFPNRITYSITAPTAAGWTPEQTIADVLQMKKASQTAYHFGPWMMYAGLYWDPYLDADYKPTYNDTTLRQRLRGIDGILDVKTVDYIPDQTLILVQQTTDVARMVIGMDITTVQWESHGGMTMNFKIMAVMLPQLRTDLNGNTGVVTGS